MDEHESSYCRDMRAITKRIETLRSRVSPEFIRGAEAAINSIRSNRSCDFAMDAMRPENLRRRRRIVMDLDGVLLDIVTAALRRANESFGTTYASNDVIEYGIILPVFQRCGGFVGFLLQNLDIWNDAPPFHGAREFVRASLELAERHRSRFLFYSALVDGEEFVSKRRWIARELGDDFAAIFKAGFGRKVDLFAPGDVVVDDCTDNLNAAKQLGADPVCIARRWNDPKGNTGYSGTRYDYEGALRRIEWLLGNR